MKINNELLKQIYEFSEEGFSNNMISKILNINPGGIGIIRTKVLLLKQERHYNKIPKQEREKVKQAVKKLKQERHSVTEISTILKITRNLVMTLIVELYQEKQEVVES